MNLRRKIIRRERNNDDGYIRVIILITKGLRSWSLCREARFRSWKRNHTRAFHRSKPTHFSHPTYWKASRVCQFIIIYTQFQSYNYLVHIQTYEYWSLAQKNNPQPIVFENF